MKQKAITEKTLPKPSKMTDKELTIVSLIKIEACMSDKLKLFLASCNDERFKRALKKAKKTNKT